MKTITFTTAKLVSPHSADLFGGTLAKSGDPFL